MLLLFNGINICFPLWQETGAIGKQIKDGIRLMGRGAEEIKWPIHFEVNMISIKNGISTEKVEYSFWSLSYRPRPGFVPELSKMVIIVLKYFFWAQFHPRTLKLTILVLELCILGTVSSMTYQSAF